jgi:hypothetical protein
MLAHVAAPMHYSPILTSQKPQVSWQDATPSHCLIRYVDATDGVRVDIHDVAGLADSKGQGWCMGKSVRLKFGTRLG